MPTRAPHYLFEQFSRVDGGAPAFGIRPSFDNLSVFEMTSQFTYAPHQHEHYEVIVVDRGDYPCVLNGKTLRLRAGDILVVKPGDWHQDTIAPPLRYFCLAFRLDAAAGGRSTSLFVPDVAP